MSHIKKWQDRHLEQDSPISYPPMHFADAEIADLRAELQAQQAEHLSTHRKLAAETLRADQGWQRYEEANADRNQLRMIKAQQQGESNVCRHDDTIRQGAIWTKCEQCGKRWADDEAKDAPEPAMLSDGQKNMLTALGEKWMSQEGRDELDEWLAASGSRQEQNTCNYPLCQSQEEQQRIAAQVHAELYTIPVLQESKDEAIRKLSDALRLSWSKMYVSGVEARRLSDEALQLPIVLAITGEPNAKP